MNSRYVTLATLLIAACLIASCDYFRDEPETAPEMPSVTAPEGEEGVVAEAEPPRPYADPSEDGWEEITHYRVRNVLYVDDLHEALSEGSENGLVFDLTNLELTDTSGEEIDAAKVYGTIYFGPYPFESAETEYSHGRLRKAASVEGGNAELPVADLLKDKYNAEGWTDRGRLLVRAELHLEAEGQDQALGAYDMFVNFRKTDEGFVKEPSLVEGPFVSMAGSTDPGSVTIWFRLDREAEASVVLNDGAESVNSEAAKRHYVELEGLDEDTDYTYHVQVGEVETDSHTFRTPPPAGQGEVVFAYTGDSREGVGTGETALMGLNHQTLSRLVSQAHARGAQFFLQGGDLVNGYTTIPDDFRTQLWGWKYTVGGFFHQAPVLTAMGNHEALLRAFAKSEDEQVGMDRWPYATESAEAVFADELVQPTNGPEPADPGRPTYDESVFTWQWGPVLVISYNDNYWYASDPTRFGGCPEGYIFQEQLDWIKEQLEAAEEDDTIKYVLLMAQEPVFPCGGHIKDAMWYLGDNNVRAHVMRDGELEPEEKGVIEMRNEFAEAIAASSKVAAVLGSDEHAYYRILIDDTVPAGQMSDDVDDDGVIGEDGEDLSTLPLEHATWYITSGGAGAPYYAEEQTPWNSYWKRVYPANYFFSSQENVMIFRANWRGISVDIYNSWGERFDGIDNLMAVKDVQPEEAD
ncbi:MAG: hypothetical protein GF393_09225, partial [Armatimonadia bacterium]|nr:hypothetical protein [Armatimonadia bacterium]